MCVCVCVCERERVCVHVCVLGTGMCVFSPLSTMELVNCTEEEKVLVGLNEVGSNGWPATSVLL